MEERTIDSQSLQIWIDGLADVMQYLTLTDNQGHDKECAQSCFTVAGVRELLQSVAESKKLTVTDKIQTHCQ
jgi:hypothetical protein